MHGLSPCWILVLLAPGPADAKEGVGALVPLACRCFHGGADLALLYDHDVVAGVEPGEGEVAVGAALEPAAVGPLVALVLPNRRCMNRVALEFVSVSHLRLTGFLATWWVRIDVRRSLSFLGRHRVAWWIHASIVCLLCIAGGLTGSTSLSTWRRLRKNIIREDNHDESNISLTSLRSSAVHQ
jgi:hypothetical protein